MKMIQAEVQIGSGTITLESGKIAKQADGAVIARLGDTMVMTTVCMAKSGAPRSFLPLTVDYRENTYAGGRIPGGFFKREGRPSEKEIITCRLIDRPLRPLFPKGYFNETQVISAVQSADGENDPDILALNSASAALAVSGIPFYHLLGAVRVGLIDGEVVFNPTNTERDISDLDLIVVGSSEAVIMVEAAANQLPESTIIDCIFKGHQEIQKIIEVQRSMAQQAYANGVRKMEWETPEAYSGELYGKIKTDLYATLKGALQTKGKFEQKDALDAVIKPYVDQIPEDDEDLRASVKTAIHDLEEEILRDVVLGEHVRLDGRRSFDIRDISVEIGLLPRVHGSALFTRGETQGLVTSTLGTRRDAQIIEEYEGESLQKFLLHYNFPPYSVGEVRFLRGPSRREIGHGVLARRALMPVLPDEEDFPYTIRVVSDITESNGSSSMATVCGGSLSMFEAGVPLKAPVAGVAMGLIKRGDQFVVLSDIAGQEDHFGDMDFKVAGSENGITALQMDIKITGVTREIMEQALKQALDGRLYILSKMNEALPTAREEISEFAPRLHTMYVPKTKIRDIIGPGGKTIRSITEETGCQIEIEDDGKVVIASPDSHAAKLAIDFIERLTESAEVGKNYTGIVRRIEPYGAFVEILPGTDGLLHISEMAPYRVGDVNDIVSDGAEIEVKVVNIDDGGKVRLSRKAVIMEQPDYDPKKYEGMDAPMPAGGDRGGRGGDRGGRGGDRGRGRGGDRGGRGGGGGRR